MFISRGRPSGPSFARVMADMQMTGIPHETVSHIKEDGKLRTYCGQPLDIGWVTRRMGSIYQIGCKWCRIQYAIRSIMNFSILSYNKDGSGKPKVHPLCIDPEIDDEEQMVRNFIEAFNDASKNGDKLEVYNVYGEVIGELVK